MVRKYTAAQMQTLLADLQTLYDLVRVVEPVQAVATLTPPNAADVPLTAHCHDVWNGRSERCINCISLRAVQTGTRQTKYEFIEQDIFYAMAVPVEVDGRMLALEMVSKVSDPVLLSAYGAGEFVSRITAFNAKLHTDQTTGLFNQPYYEEKLYLMLQKAALNKTDLAVAMLEVDGFEHVASHFGHHVADEAIIAIGHLLSANISRRRGDFIARYSTHTFAIVMDNIPRRLLRERMVDLVRRVTSLRLLGYEDVRLNVATGVFLLSDQRDASCLDVTTTAARRVEIARAAGFNRIAFSDR